MRLIRALAFLTLLFLALAATACREAENHAPVVDQFGWILENFDETYWTKRGVLESNTAFVHFWISVQDPEGDTDITYVSVADGVDHIWILEDAATGKSHYDADAQVWGGWNVSFGLAQVDHLVHLGTYTATVRDSTEQEATKTQVFSGPGAETGYGFAYSEDYTGSITGGTPMLKRATVSSATKLSDRLVIQFGVNDDRVYDGFLWIYDSAAQYITATPFFRSSINAGSGILKNGSTNNLEILLSEIDLGTHQASELVGFHVVLTDGAQYAPVAGYDHRSTSEYTLFDP